MSYGKNVNIIAEERLNRIRNSVFENQAREKEKIYSRLPRLRDIEKELTNIGTQAGKAVLLGKDAKAVSERLAERSIALQREKNSILFNNGYTKDALEPHYHCKKCHDTGRYENYEGITVLCECLKRIRTKVACEELNKVSPLSLSTFESFSLEHYDMDVFPGSNTSPYERMRKILEYCKRYSTSFTLSSPSILMKGATGLGKTHLSLAIANEVINMGFGVIYVSAPMILSKLEKQHFSYAYDEEEQTINSLVECDLLIIDDLGTEFQSSYNSSTIYNIFNTRLLNNRPTVINTNLTLKEMEGIYTQRFVSRVMGNCAKLDFIGTDIRRPQRR
ncbi:MAG: ATP-binding protein [Ruminococcus sp.]|nr:ATP-binding protein [Ruminococcus sp.]